MLHALGRLRVLRYISTFDMFHPLLVRALVLMIRPHLIHLLSGVFMA